MFSVFRQNKNKSYTASFTKQKAETSIPNRFASFVSQCTIIAHVHMNLFVKHSAIIYRTQAQLDHGMRIRI